MENVQKIKNVDNEMSKMKLFIMTIILETGTSLEIEKSLLQLHDQQEFFFLFVNL